MLPPPGLVPTITSLLENASQTPTAIASSSFLNLGVDIPTSTISSVLSLATAVSTTAKPKEPENGECKLLGKFAILVQTSLGLLALLALVYKRWRERPQRPMKIWFFDVSKQVVGSVLVHIANILMSMLSSGQFSIKISPETVSARSIDLVRRLVDGEGHYSPNPCSFYLLNLAIDTTVGIPILILLLRILTALFLLTPIGNPPESIASGNYGHPPRAWWWFKQSIIYFIGLMGMKLCVLIIFLVAPWISRVGDWALKWTEGDEVLQVVFVMLVFPVIMNATQYYIIDSFIKNQKPDHEQIPDEDSESEEDSYTESPRTSEDGVDADDDVEVLAKTDSGKKVQVETVKSKRALKGSGSGIQSPLKTGNRDYDPLYDGESSPTVVGSTSTSGVRAEDSEEERKLASR